MITGIGVDIAEISRFTKLLERFGEKFARRLLTPAEYNQFVQRNHSATFLASRFAAKEAASKALGTGIACGLNFHSLQVTNNQQGKPELILHDMALTLSQQQGVKRTLLSISDEKQFVVAMVVMEGD
jgi:holo-[acyl-carrier protein] synthase